MNNDDSKRPLYQDPTKPLSERVEDLLARMTLVEKVAQVSAVSLRDSVAAEEGVAGIVKAVRDGIGHGIGQIENTFDPRLPRESAEEVNDLQRLLVEHTRLKIPALIGSECAHGHAARNSTILPVPLAMASSWNPSLVEQGFRMAGRESRSRGCHEAHTPVLDLGRDPRWGRIEETFGEDTYLVTQMGLAAVAGLQGGRSGTPGGDHVVASPKHFAGYGQVVGGRNFAATPIDSRTLFDEVLPPFEAAVKEAGAQGMMASHCEVEGVPAHGNRWLLSDLLKGEWGFEGYVVSDYNDVPRLEFFQHVVSTIEEAAALALQAGMDVDLPVGEAYGRLVPVIETRPELASHLDESVRRVLRLKFLLGLFEEPFVDPATAEAVVGCEAHVRLTEQIAAESVVLLKNEQGRLPLNRETLKTIAVIGPNGASREVGNYTVESDHVVSILEGVRSGSGPRTEVLYSAGCTIADVTWDGRQTILKQASLEAELPLIEEAVALAKKSDVALLCVGGSTETSREAFYVDGIKGDRATLGLLGNQEELVLRVLETGTPVIVILMGGRPYSIPAIAEKADAVLNTFYLGQANGMAVARILFGEVNPSGKLPLTIPRSVGQLPVYYSQKAISFYKDYLDEDPGPLFPFGFGLSYTQFEYKDLRLEKAVLPITEEVSFGLSVTNTGAVAGAEVVQVYVRDCVASVVRPAKLLVRFEKVFLEAGQSCVLRFSLHPQKDLAFTGIKGEKLAEAGLFELFAGGSSVDLPLRVTFELFEGQAD